MAEPQPTLPDDEQWRPVVGFEGKYAVSNLGQIKSLSRIVEGYGGRRWSTKELMMKFWENPSGHLQVTLSDGYGNQSRHYVHRIVAEAFIGTIGDDQFVRHWDDNPKHNRPENLVLGMPKDNTGDMYRNRLDPISKGTHRNKNLTHCHRGHAFDAENTYWRNEGGRRCRKCKNENERARHLRKKLSK